MAEAEKKALIKQQNDGKNATNLFFGKFLRTTNSSPGSLDGMEAIDPRTAPRTRSRQNKGDGGVRARMRDCGYRLDCQSVSYASLLLLIRACAFVRTNIFPISFLVWTTLVLRHAQFALMRLSLDTRLHKKHEMAWTIGGAFVALTVPMTVRLTLKHLMRFVEPRQQSQTIRIIWTVPVYAVSSWLCLRFPHKAIYIQCVREVYEAYVIYCFLQYLVYYLGESELAPKLALKPAIVGHHKPPFCCLEPWTMGTEFLDGCKIGVLQFVVVRFCTTFAAMLMQWLGIYGEGHLSPWRGFFWVSVTNSLSQGWALYVLFLFYHATHKDLVQIDPFGKFLCIKAIVFFSYWQGVVIGLLVHQGSITEMDMHSAEIVARAIKDLLVCMEMFVASIAYQFMFPVTDFTKSFHPERELEKERCTVRYALYTSCIPLELQGDIWSQWVRISAFYRRLTTASQNSTDDAAVRVV